MNDIPKLVPTRPDTEVAADLKARIATGLQGLLPIMDECIAAGFIPSFGIALGPLGRHIVGPVDLVKKF